MTSVLFELKNAVGIIRLNRPEKLNAFNREMALALQEVLDDCAAETQVRAIYLTGNGKAFSAGQDLAELTASDAPSFEQILAEHYNPVVLRIKNMEKPVVCAVNGVAAGAGANIALCCDIVVASRSASFIQAFSKIGLVPDSGGTFNLPRLIGWQKASALMLLGEKVSAEEAEKMGMIYKVFEDDQFAGASMQMAVTLASMPSRALAYTKQALNASLHNSFAQQLQLEDSLQYKCAQTYDYQEGMQAFLQKRTPRFTGE